jgi:hypothetical protein
MSSTAAETGLGFKTGTFEEAYRGNRKAAVEEALEVLPIGAYALALMDTAVEWSGTFTELLKALNALQGRTRSRRTGPKPLASCRRT